jgi:hypothetical protein
MDGDDFRWQPLVAILSAVLIGEVSLSVDVNTHMEILMNNSVAVMACVGCGVARLRRPGGSLPPINDRGMVDIDGLLEEFAPRGFDSLSLSIYATRRLAAPIHSFVY